MLNALKTNKNRIFNLLKVAVSLALIVIILRSVDLNVLWGVVRQANVWYLAAAVVVSIIGVLVRGVRWQILLHDQGVPASLREITALWFISFLFTNLLPSGIGGDAVKAYELSRSTGQSAQVISTVLVDRFTGLFALQAIALAALLFSWWLIPGQIVILTVVIFGASLLVAWVVSSKPLWSGLARHIPLFARFLTIKSVHSLVTSLQSYSRSALIRVQWAAHLHEHSARRRAGRTSVGGVLHGLRAYHLGSAYCSHLVRRAGRARGHVRVPVHAGRSSARGGTLAGIDGVRIRHSVPGRDRRCHLPGARRARLAQPPDG
jgi:hypothetical protein